MPGPVGYEAEAQAETLKSKGRPVHWDLGKMCQAVVGFRGSLTVLPGLPGPEATGGGGPVCWVLVSNPALWALPPHLCGQLGPHDLRLLSCDILRTAVTAPYQPKPSLFPNHPQSRDQALQRGSRGPV